jgi:HEPN domain-containing protein
MEGLAVALCRNVEAEEVILFGSQARGTQRDGSDADVLVIAIRSGTHRDEVGRAIAAYRVDFPRGPYPQVFVWSRAELVERLASGNVVARDALREGLVLARDGDVRVVGVRSRHAELADTWSHMAAAEEWLRTAQEDLMAARASLTVEVAWGAAFHAQQAAEKALKALVYHLGLDPSRTHDLCELVDEVAAVDGDLGRSIRGRHGAALEHMSPFAVAGRYPGYPVSERDAVDAIEGASALIAEVAELVG